jgi:hypothetical protein
MSQNNEQPHLTDVTHLPEVSSLPVLTADREDALGATGRQFIDHIAAKEASGAKDNGTDSRNLRPQCTRECLSIRMASLSSI